MVIGGGPAAEWPAVGEKKWPSKWTTIEEETDSLPNGRRSVAGYLPQRTAVCLKGHSPMAIT